MNRDGLLALADRIEAAKEQPIVISVRAAEAIREMVGLRPEGTQITNDEALRILHWWAMGDSVVYLDSPEDKLLLAKLRGERSVPQRD